MTEKLGLTGPPQDIGPRTVTQIDHGIECNRDSSRRFLGAFLDVVGLGTHSKFRRIESH